MPSSRLSTTCQLEPQAVGRTENLGPVREALLGWRAGEPPEPVQRLDETKELSPRGLAGGSVALSTGGWVLWEVSRHHHGMLKAICRSWRRGGGGCRWTAEAPPSFAVEVEEDRKEDENHRSRRDHEIDRPNMHSFQRQTISDCLVFGARRGGFTHICVGSGSTAGRLSEGLAPRAPQAD